MPKNKNNKKYYIFITFSFFALASFFLIISFLKYNNIQATNNKENKETEKISQTDPLIISSRDFYSSFIRQNNPVFGQGGLKIIVFADLLDEKSKEILKDLKKIRNDDKMLSQVQVVWKTFLLASNTLSQSVAEASLCAFKQNKFWEFADLLVEYQDSLTEEKFLDFAKNLNLDLKSFEDCFNSKEMIETIGLDMEDAGKLLIEGVPYVFVDSRRVGIDELDDLLEIMEEEISNL